MNTPVNILVSGIPVEMNRRDWLIWNRFEWHLNQVSVGARSKIPSETKTGTFRVIDFNIGTARKESGIGFFDKTKRRAAISEIYKNCRLSVSSHDVASDYLNSGAFFIHGTFNATFRKIGSTPSLPRLPADYSRSNEANQNQKPCEQYELPLYAHIFIGLGCAGIAIGGMCRTIGICRLVLVVLGGIGLLTDYGWCGFGNPVTFWRFHWLWGEENCQNNQPSHNADTVNEKIKLGHYPLYRGSFTRGVK